MDVSHIISLASKTCLTMRPKLQDDVLCLFAQSLRSPSSRCWIHSSAFE
jgi:hypothetical protein